MPPSVEPGGVAVDGHRAVGDGAAPQGEEDVLGRAGDRRGRLVVAGEVDRAVAGGDVPRRRRCRSCARSSGPLGGTDGLAATSAGAAPGRSTRRSRRPRARRRSPGPVRRPLGVPAVHRRLLRLPARPHPAHLRRRGTGATSARRGRSRPARRPAARPPARNQAARPGPSFCGAGSGSGAPGRPVSTQLVAQRCTPPRCTPRSPRRHSPHHGTGASSGPCSSARAKRSMSARRWSRCSSRSMTTNGRRRPGRQLARNPGAAGSPRSRRRQNGSMTSGRHHRHAPRPGAGLRQRQRRRRAARGARRPGRGRTTATRWPTAPTVGRPRPRHASATCSARQSQAFLVWNGTGANVMALATLARPGRRRGVQRVGAHRGRRDRRARARRRRQAAAPSRRSTPSCSPEQLRGARPPDRRRSTTPSRPWCRSPRAPSSAPCTPRTRSPRCATRPTRLGHASCTSTARGSPTPPRRSAARSPRCGRSPSTPASTSSASAGRRPAWRSARPSCSSTPRSPTPRRCTSASRSTSCPSKMRFVAAQFNALLHDDLWIRAAEHANAMAQPAVRLTDELPTVAFADAPPRSTACSRCCRRPTIEPLREWCFFWDWDVAAHQVRWMTSWDTTTDDVERFAAGVLRPPRSVPHVGDAPRNAERGAIDRPSVIACTVPERVCAGQGRLPAATDLEGVPWLLSRRRPIVRSPMIGG